MSCLNRLEQLSCLAFSGKHDRCEAWSQARANWVARPQPDPHLHTASPASLSSTHVQGGGVAGASGTGGGTP